MNFVQMQVLVEVVKREEKKLKFLRNTENKLECEVDSYYNKRKNVPRPLLTKLKKVETERRNKAIQIYKLKEGIL